MLTILAVDEILSRESLALAEKYLIRAGKDNIEGKLKNIGDYKYYFTSKNIYDYLMDNVKNGNLVGVEVLEQLKELAECGKLDIFVE